MANIGEGIKRRWVGRAKEQQVETDERDGDGDNEQKPEGSDVVHGVNLGG